MNTWFDTVCRIAAGDLGMRTREVRFLMTDLMDIAHAAYNDYVPAASFALELVTILHGVS